MGNQNTKNSNKSLFTSEEIKVLESTFRSVCGHSEKLSQEKLLATWSTFIDPHLAQSISNYLFANDGHRIPSISFDRYTEPFYVVNRGTMDEKANFIAASLESPVSDVSLRTLENYIATVLRSFIGTQTSQANSKIHTWLKLGYTSTDRSILPFSKALARNSTQPNKKSGFCDLERWLHQNPIFLCIWNEVFTDLYSTYGGKTHKLGISMETFVLPLNEGLRFGTNYIPILDLPHVIFINSNLPNEKRDKWRFLFSSKIHGESFSTMLGKISNKGSTIFVVEDEDHFIFSGYAPQSWSLGPNFVGDDTSMLFTISPALRCFNTTGYNDHYQYLNLNQQTMPNGLGMGGQFNFWGLWIDCEYGKGQSSESCTTYRDYVQLSKRKEFRIKTLEVWGVGDEPIQEDDLSRPTTNKNSVLDSNGEERAMLEIAGKHMASTGFREEESEPESRNYDPSKRRNPRRQ